jgi:UDP-GlcNAc:undecaprenyl-phosphate GlcNAc-1-phosphate transferase
MTSIIIISLCLVVASYFLTLYFIKNASKLGLIDIPNDRSSHKEPIPRGAGIIFGALFLIAILLYDFSFIIENYLLFLALCIIYFLGLCDDKIGLGAKVKLFVILIAAFFVFINGYQITSLGEYFGYEIQLPWVLSLVFTLFAIGGFTNALNLTDGLDGLAGTNSIIMLTSILYIGISRNDFTLISWSSFLIASVLGFLFLNWHPAKVFMGDSGSLFLGFAIAILAIKTLEYVNPVSILLFAAMPILDTLIVFRRRTQRGISPFKADKNHLHHMVNKVKGDKKFTAKVLISMQMLFTILFIQVRDQDDLSNMIIFVLIFFLFFNLFDPRSRIRPEKSFVRKKHINNKKSNK